MICKTCGSEITLQERFTSPSITLKDGTKFSWLRCEQCSKKHEKTINAIFDHAKGVRT